MSQQNATLILSQEQIQQKVNRLAYQVYEENFEEKEIVVCGIADRGYQLAELICKKLEQIAKIKASLVKVKVNKGDLIDSEVNIEPDVKLKNKTVILCDDVLYTGKTMAYAAAPFLQKGIKKLQCLVLVHRHHLNFPIQPTFIGMSLATTLQEHVNVNLTGNVFLE